MPLTNYALDKFVAPKLSELTVCGAQPLPETRALLGAAILNTVVGRTPRADKQCAWVFNLVRRLDQATFEYEQGRADLCVKIERPRLDHLELYFRALAHFEQCLANFYQFAAFCGPKKKMFKPRGSVRGRIEKIYNISHHMDGKILQEKVATGVSTPVWLLNEGIACEGVIVTFTELRDELVNGRTAVKNLLGVA